MHIVIAKAMVLIAEKISICVASRRVLQPVILTSLRKFSSCLSLKKGDLNKQIEYPCLVVYP